MSNLFSLYGRNYFDRVSTTGYLHSRNYGRIGKQNIGAGNELLQNTLSIVRSEKPQELKSMIEEQKMREYLKIEQLYLAMDKQMPGGLTESIKKFNNEYMKQLTLGNKLSSGELNSIIGEIISEELVGVDLRINQFYLVALRDLAESMRVTLANPKTRANNVKSILDEQDFNEPLERVLENLNNVISSNEKLEITEIDMTIEQAEQILAGQLTALDVKKQELNYDDDLISNIEYTLAVNVDGHPQYKAGDSLEEQLDSLLDRQIISRFAKDFADDLSSVLKGFNLITGEYKQIQRSQKLYNQIVNYNKTIEILVNWKLASKINRETTAVNFSINALGKGGDLNIVKSGSISDFTYEMDKHSATRPIAELLKNRLFIYFLVNEMFDQSSGPRNQTFFKRFYDLLKYGAYAFLGKDIDEIRDNFGLGNSDIDFLFVKGKIIPLSAILERMYESPRFIQGTKLNLQEAISPSMVEKEEAIINVRNHRPRYRPEEWYSDNNLLSSGKKAADNFIEEIKYRLSITGSIINEVIGIYS